MTSRPRKLLLSLKNLIVAEENETEKNKRKFKSNSISPKKDITLLGKFGNDGQFLFKVSQGYSRPRSTNTSGEKNEFANVSVRRTKLEQNLQFWCQPELFPQTL